MYTIRKLARRQGLSRSIYSYSVGGVLAFVAALGCERTPAPKPSLRAPQPVSAAASDSAVPASAPVSSAPPQPAGWPSAPSPRPIPDKGIYPDLDARVATRLPSWLQTGPASVIEAGPARYVTIDGVPVGFAPKEATTAFRVDSPAPWDRDGDTIPDSLDILLGAKKTVLNAAAYKSTYRVIPYPGGDMPRTEGVCTDVVVRALRNAGIDLQKAVHEDAKVRRSAYPGITKPDRNIDHRRVRNLLPYFKRYWTSLPTDPKDASVPWLPGDVVLLDTMNDPQPEHMGIVSDSLAQSGLPLVINNWTDGDDDGGDGSAFFRAGAASVPGSDGRVAGSVRASGCRGAARTSGSGSTGWNKGIDTAAAVGGNPQPGSRQEESSFAIDAMRPARGNGLENPPT